MSSWFSSISSKVCSCAVGWCIASRVLCCQVCLQGPHSPKEVGVIHVESGGDGVDWVSGPGGAAKRFRLNRKTPAHLGGLGSHSRPRVWRRLIVREHLEWVRADAKSRPLCQQGEAFVPVEDRTGVG